MLSLGDFLSALPDNRQRTSHDRGHSTNLLFLGRASYDYIKMNFDCAVDKVSNKGSIAAVARNSDGRMRN